MKKTFFPAFLLLLLILNGNAQTIFVDVVKGNGEGSGSSADPISSLEKAVELANGYSGRDPITIKIAPGLYIVHQVMELKPKPGDEATKFTVESTIMPDDTAWTPYKMPIIESVSLDNMKAPFPHCAGFLVSRNNVSIKGLKFVGNANPDVKYYYPVNREDQTRFGLEISQCYFVGEKNSLPIQGALWTEGAGMHVDHCIFYGCKNALLLFRSIKDFSVTNSIIYNSYESAVWFGNFDSDFVFSNNIVSHCNYFWVRPDSTKPAYHFINSLISENSHVMGYYTKNGLIEAKQNADVETNVRRKGKVLLVEVGTEGIPKDYLNLVAESDGKDLHAGIFKK